MNLKNLKTRIWEWGITIPGEGYMQITVPCNGRIQSEAKNDFISEYGDRYEFLRIFLMTSTRFGIHFRKKVFTSQLKIGDNYERKTQQHTT